ncbi:30S ribosomal protein S20 [Alienimonas californiensis]|uniref:Small ribosomal subunit protein bS20 n=1 Tax=Alienimonas californiensis TaxID=2527989 RepID=A0A517P7L0_9PLAN|nr:30S ribosomal protein S20 [Alienimonas californiensis]QDT15359.1 30S ribosomal protein S20 [Alienimonas californiensis]
MPNSPSAKKALRKSQKRRLVNRSNRSALRTNLKKARVAVEGQPSEAADDVKTAMRHLDISAGRGLIHKNKAARLKSRLAKKLNAALTES